MSELTATGEYQVMGSGFIAMADSDHSEGRGGRYEIGRYDDLGEALAAVRGEGVQGDDGYINRFEYRLYEGGLLRDFVVERVYDRHQTAEGRWKVGFVGSEAGR